MIKFRITNVHDINQTESEVSTDVYVDFKNVYLASLKDTEGRLNKETIVETCVNVYNSLFYADINTEDIHDKRVQGSINNNLYGIKLLRIVIGHFLMVNDYTVREANNFLHTRPSVTSYSSQYYKKLKVQKDVQVLDKVLTKIFKVLAPKPNLYKDE